MSWRYVVCVCVWEGGSVCLCLCVSLSVLLCVSLSVYHPVCLCILPSPRVLWLKSRDTNLINLINRRLVFRTSVVTDGVNAVSTDVAFVAALVSRSNPRQRRRYSRRHRLLQRRRPTSTPKIGPHAGGRR